MTAVPEITRTSHGRVASLGCPPRPTLPIRCTTFLVRHNTLTTPFALSPMVSHSRGRLLLAHAPSQSRPFSRPTEVIHGRGSTTPPRRRGIQPRSCDRLRFCLEGPQFWTWTPLTTLANFHMIHSSCTCSVCSWCSAGPDTYPDSRRRTISNT